MVFVANGAGKVLSSGFVGAGDARAFAQKLREVVERADQKGVASGVGNGAMKLHIFFHAIFAARHRLIELIQGLMDELNVFWRALDSR